MAQIASLKLRKRASKCAKIHAQSRRIYSMANIAVKYERNRASTKSANHARSRRTYSMAKTAAKYERKRGPQQVAQITHAAGEFIQWQKLRRNMKGGLDVKQKSRNKHRTNYLGAITRLSMQDKRPSRLAQRK